MQKTSLFDNIKSQIPSIDADVLYSDLLKSVTQPFIDGTNDDLNSQKDCLTSQLPAKHKQHSTEASTVAELEESTPNSTERENLTSKTVHHSKLLNEKLTFVHQESRKHHTDSQAAAVQNSLTECSKVENDSMLQTTVKVYESQSLENTEHLYTRPYPVLSLQTLENLDLDQVLQSLKQHGYPKETTKEEGHVLFQPFKNTGNGRKRENNIMEQLAAFCKKQSCNETETQTISSDEKRLQRPCKKNYSTTRTLTGKSLLLQKRREANRIKTERNVGETAEGGAKPEKEKTSRVPEDCQG
ncbi:uncharacterized protein LOC134306418 [Trichomycterus rosablanca]|uniref:uncharacterized protein LOC134306418 n=1 Tax=Trichomycterus rosablanca TaxID=2290929 RepID=UPI002F354DA2